MKIPSIIADEKTPLWEQRPSSTVAVDGDGGGGGDAARQEYASFPIPQRDRNRNRTKPTLLLLLLLVLALAAVVVAALSVSGSSRVHHQTAASAGANAESFLANAGADATTAGEEEEHYSLLSFEVFAERFGKSYATDAERSRRRAIYEENLAIVATHNAAAANGSRTWTMGVNQFTDLLPSELPTGFDKTLPHGPTAGMHLASGPSAQVTTTTGDGDRGDRRLREEVRIDAGRGIDLPSEVDWRDRVPSVITPVKNQGLCGSCWAVAAATALETHAALKTGLLDSLSSQELVSCSENPEHCGGTGGCVGSTAELAYDYVIRNGLGTEWSLGYTSHLGDDGTCPPGYARNPVVEMTGYKSLTQNSHEELLEAVALVGPVAVTVSAVAWGHYRNGVFDDSDMVETHDINHAVTVEGYGTDEETGLDYWLVRNSWGVKWGERGYIRLKRDDPGAVFPPDLLTKNNNNENNDDGWKGYCKPDLTPLHGIACSGPNNDRDPPPQLVCGTSGILYDSVYPLGVSRNDVGPKRAHPETTDRS